MFVCTAGVNYLSQQARGIFKRFLGHNKDNPCWIPPPPYPCLGHGTHAVDVIGETGPLLSLRLVSAILFGVRVLAI